MSSTTEVAFTICSNNYLGQALALKESFLEHNPGFQFYIVLVDTKHPNIDYDVVKPARLLPIADIETLDVPDLIERYYIIELNTSVKPTAFKYLTNLHPNATALYYLDPDLYFYNSVQALNDKLQTKTGLLTPHVLSPIPRDGLEPEENTFLRFGIYNLGFFAINPQREEAKRLLDWWEERVVKYGYDRPTKGYFVDQLWMAQAPLFFKDIEVLDSYGYNMAPWNLHEREIITIQEDNIVLNDGNSLIFYHFSKLSEDPQAISREYNRYDFSDFPKLKKIYKEYMAHLKKVDYHSYKKIPIGYPVRMNLKAPVKKRSQLSKMVQGLANRLDSLAKKL
ncbi:hypothetical protein MG296_08305 [Flavobacteriaceae bacterium TK19130]|nr:hypothetical protein [Thermobacterium salinum]